MRLLKLIAPGFALATVLAASSAQATDVRQMNLEQLVNASETIMLGTIVGIEGTTVEVGGGTLPAVAYKVRVEEAFKGEFSEVKGVKVAEFKMVGSLKDALAGRHPIVDFPVLKTGNEYLLMVAPAGPTGLTSTMGLGQGLFNVTGSGASRVLLNGSNNVGLFNGMNVPYSGGGIGYLELAEMIRVIVGGN